MKKLLAALLTLILLCAPALAASELEIASALDAALAEHLPSGYTLDVSTSYATIDLHLIGMDYITDYGSYIYYLMEAVADIYPDVERVEFSLSDGSLTNPSFLEFTARPQLWADIRYGELIDYRSGSPIEYDIKTLDDLIALFPAMAADGIGSGISQSDLDLYNEVMDILNSDYTRSEEEILEEIAPNYGMTSDELYTFLLDVMEQLYS